jgi:hypothetical protein
LSSTSAFATVVAAEGTPPEQDTVMVTVLAVVVNTTRAALAGPRITLPAWKPCWGLQDSRKAPAVAHRATTEPPDEARTVPPFALVPPAPPVPLAPLVRPVLSVPAVLSVPPSDGGRGEDNGCAAWPACAWLIADTVGCWLGEPVMPSPSSDTTSRLPAVAAAAPRSHAPVAITVRVRMPPRVVEATLSAGKARLKENGGRQPAITGFGTRNGAHR